MWMRSATSQTWGHVVADQDHWQAAFAEAFDHLEDLSAPGRPMPCDGAWSEERLGLFQRWAENGKLE
jgi:hypothetical protein